MTNVNHKLLLQQAIVPEIISSSIDILPSRHVHHQHQHQHHQHHHGRRILRNFSKLVDLWKVTTMPFPGVSNYKNQSHIKYYETQHATHSHAYSTMEILYRPSQWYSKPFAHDLHSKKTTYNIMELLQDHIARHITKPLHWKYQLFYNI